jgi:hypothetical protein
MTVKVGDIAVIVCRKVTQIVVLEGGSEDDSTGRMGKASQMRAILFRHDLFGLLAFLAVVEEYRVIGAASDSKFSSIVIVNGRYIRLAIFLLFSSLLFRLWGRESLWKVLDRHVNLEETN